MPWLPHTGIILLALAVVPARAAETEFSVKDAQVLGRTLGYVGDGVTGAVVVGVAFSPAVPVSQQDADRVRAVIGDGLPTGRVRLQARLVAVDQLAGAAGFDAFYVTQGLGDGMDAVFSAARRLHVPTISTSPACLQSGDCVVGFSTEPKVEIVIDSASAARTGVRFMQAFRMLVKEK
nr:hypothetical protein [uncultured Lichenicoccus sp.]